MKIRITLWINLFKQLQRISTQGRQFLMESKQSYYWRLARVIEKAAPFLIFWTKQVLRLYILILLLKKAKTKTGNKSEQSTLSLSVHNFTRYAVEWGKIFTKDWYIDYVNSSQNSRAKQTHKQKTIQLKNRQKTGRDSSQKRIFSWQISRWKGVQHHQSWMKCKSKSQWELGVWD